MGEMPSFFPIGARRFFSFCSFFKGAKIGCSQLFQAVFHCFWHSAWNLSIIVNVGARIRIQWASLRPLKNGIPRGLAIIVFHSAPESELVVQQIHLEVSGGSPDCGSALLCVAQVLRCYSHSQRVANLAYPRYRSSCCGQTFEKKRKVVVPAVGTTISPVVPVLS